MKEHVFILFLLFGISSCDYKEKSTNSIPEIFKPNLEGIDVEIFPVEIGNVLEFKIENLKIVAIVLDYKIEKNKKYIGLCFLNGNKLFGRQIPNGLINTTCIDLLDLSYLYINSDLQYKIIDKLVINKDKVGIGSLGFAENVDVLKKSYLLGINQRKKQQTPCDKNITQIDAVNECYFGIEKYKN